MSYSSIAKNNEAISKINEAIKKYTNAKNKIELSNKNVRAELLITHINDNIGYLNGIKSQLSTINGTIADALKAKEEARKEAEEAAARRAQSAQNDKNSINENRKPRNNLNQQNELK